MAMVGRISSLKQVLQIGKWCRAGSWPCRTLLANPPCACACSAQYYCLTACCDPWHVVWGPAGITLSSHPHHLQSLPERSTFQPLPTFLTTSLALANESPPTPVLPQLLLISFEEGIKGMHIGGQRRIIVPPELGPPVGPSTFFSAKQYEV